MLVTASTYQDALFLLLGDNSDRSRILVKEFLDITDKDSGRHDITTIDDELVLVFKSLIKSVMSEKISQDNQTSAKLLLLKIRENEILKAHPTTRDILIDVLSSQEIISADQINEYLKRLRNILVGAQLDDTAKKMFAKARTLSSISDADEQQVEINKLRTLLDQSLKSIEQRQSSSDAKASDAYVSFSDPSTMAKAISTYMKRSVTGVLKTGLQGLNKALGSRGGLGIGETAVFAAPSHHYKSGILISWLIWCITYNSFEALVEPGKKALLYFVSLENEIHQNLMIVFKALYCRLEKRNVDLGSMSEEFIVTWLINYFSQYNVEVIIDRYVPHEFSYKKFIGRYNHFVDLGFQMIMFDLDYMSEARGIDPDDTFSSQGQLQLIKENYIKFPSHAKQCGYTLITGHQLTKQADTAAAGGGRNPVKKFNPSMMADSPDVFRAVDFLAFMYLENNINDVKFLTMQVRKNRGAQDTPEKDKFFAYAFNEFGIEDDLFDVPRYTKDIDAWGFEGGVVGSQVVDAAMF